MKKVVLMLTVTMLLLISGMNLVKAQEQPAPKKDTVNMDTEAKPTFYYAIEDDKPDVKSNKGSFPLIPVVAGVVVIGGIAAFFVLKKKK